MMLGILTLITALSISAVAIYYSVAGLVAIFAAAAIPIMIMGGVLEVSKLVTAVWLHRYWSQATWWLKTYLSTAVVVLMLITSMGIFGFLSKAHIEQTSASEESVAQVERLTTEIARQNGIVARAEERIQNLQNNGVGADANIQSQIDKEQERIDKAYERIQPAIDQQNQIITDARTADGSRTKPYEDQLASIQAEILRLETSAREYEDKIASLSADTSAVQPLLEQIDSIEAEIIRVTNQLQSSEQAQIRAGQAIIGVTSDGFFGNNTREALAKWVSAQQDRIAQIQGDISQLRKDATGTVDSERVRLAGVVKDIREKQIPALKDRELTMLGKIDEVRQTESPAIQTARDEIQRLRESAESQVAQSQSLIERLRAQLAQEDKAADIEAAIDEQNNRIREANKQIDTLTEEKYALEAEYRKLEAEVGPVKYIAEFIYGEQANTNLLEEAVRWVIIVIIFVFDPLAVLLLIASQYTFEFARRKDDDGGWLRQYEQIRAQRIVDNPGFDIGASAPPTKEEEVNVTTEKEGSGDTAEDTIGDGLTPGTYTGDSQTVPMEQDEDSKQVEETVNGMGTTDVTGTGDNGGDSSSGMALAGKDLEEYAKSYITTNDDLGNVVSENDTTNTDVSVDPVEQPEVQVDETVEPQKKNIESSEELNQNRKQVYEDRDQNDATWKEAKHRWKDEHPDQTLKRYKDLYIKGVIDELPWEGYQQNAEQNESSIFNRIKRNQQDQDNNPS